MVRAKMPELVFGHASRSKGCSKPSCGSWIVRNSLAECVRNGRQPSTEWARIFEIRSESRHLQHQQHQQTAAEPFGVAGKEQAPCGLPTGTQGGTGSVPGGLPTSFGVRGRLAGRAFMEWCRHSRSPSRARFDPYLFAWTCNGHAGSLHRSSRERSIDCLYLPP